VFSFTGVVILGAGCGLAWKDPDGAIARRAARNIVSTVRHSKIWLAMSQMGQLRPNMLGAGEHSTTGIARKRTGEPSSSVPPLC
jgi:hypothetical protein